MSDIPTQFLPSLDEVIDELKDMIDGGEECQGRDSRILFWIGAIEHAQSQLEKLLAYAGHERSLGREAADLDNVSLRNALEMIVAEYRKSDAAGIDVMAQIAIDALACGASP